MGATNKNGIFLKIGSQTNTGKGSKMGLSITVGQEKTGDITNIGSLGAGGGGKKENLIQKICLYRNYLFAII